MHQNQIFNQTRWRLAVWYAGVMGVILSLCSVGFYTSMAHARWQALHHELDSIAGTLHDSLEPDLTKPGQIEPRAQQSLPGLCLVDSICSTQTGTRHVLGAVQQAGYYARFFTQAGQLVATVGEPPERLPFQAGDEIWQTLTVADSRFHQISLLLKTSTHQPWGYLQVGRSLQEIDNNLATTRLIILLGLPVAMLLISGASWCLAGWAMRPVYQSYRQIQQFTADAAHELRTPLAATRATVESALELEPLPDAEAKGALRTVERQTIRLAQLVQDLLLLSRMDLQVLTLKQQPCHLNTLIIDLIDEFEAIAIAHAITLTPDVLVDRPLFVWGDDEQLYRLFANLVINAIQHTPDGGNVIIQLSQAEQSALVQVQDTGVGIPLEEQSRIFDRFYRVNSDRSRKTGGSGLGLAIAQAIAQTHGGLIRVNSSGERGSSFSVYLPLSHKL